MNDSSKATVWFIVGLVVLVTVGLVVLGIIYGGGSSSSATSADSGFVATTAPAITSADWKEGNPNAKVTLIEYGDFECPACGEYYPLVKQLVSQYSNQILFVFRNFPILTFICHPEWQGHHHAWWIVSTRRCDA